MVNLSSNIDVPLEAYAVLNSISIFFMYDLKRWDEFGVRVCAQYERDTHTRCYLHSPGLVSCICDGTLESTVRTALHSRLLGNQSRLLLQLKHLP
jgi:hypothetical protein